MSAAEHERAIAYLKARVPDDDPAPVVVLPEDDAPVLLDYAPGLFVSYVVDHGTHFEFINNRQASALGREELHLIGLRNLAAAAQAIEVRSYGAIYAVTAGGNFEASLLLLDDLWDRGFRQFVPGAYVAAVPARDILAFGDANEPEVRQQLRALIDRVYPDGDHLLTDQLLLRSGAGWIISAD